MNLSPNFTLEELTSSETAQRLGIDNAPSQEIIDALTTLCYKLLEPARALLGVPFHIDSGYRCAALNAAVGGSATSEHEIGHAADCVPEGIELRDAFDRLRASDLPYDQIITECNAWIHLGMAAEGIPPRRQALSALGSAGHWVYSQVRS
jgi:hypothetical protein